MKNLAFRLSALLQNVEENYDNPLFKQSVTEILGDTIRKMNDIVKHFRENQEQIVVKLRVDLNQTLTGLLKALPSRMTRNLQIDLKLNELPLIWGDCRNSLRHFEAGRSIGRPGFSYREP